MYYCRCRNIGHDHRRFFFETICNWLPFILQKPCERKQFAICCISFQSHKLSAAASIHIWLTDSKNCFQLKFKPKKKWIIEPTEGNGEKIEEFRDRGAEEARQKSTNHSKQKIARKLSQSKYKSFIVWPANEEKGENLVFYTSDSGTPRHGREQSSKEIGRNCNFVVRSIHLRLMQRRVPRSWERDRKSVV